jgi:hypothetical protein
MALRIIVEVVGNEVRLVHSSHVDMPAPARRTTSAATTEGMYVEMRDERNEARYQESISPQLEGGVEVFSPDGSARRIDVGDRKQTVMLVLPDDAAARSLVFLRTPVSPRGGAISAEGIAEPEEIARFPLNAGDNT